MTDIISIGPGALVALTIAGAVAGWINTLAGGGSILTVPAMLFFGLPGPVANGTNRVAVLVQSLSAISVFAKSGYADFRQSLAFAATASVGAVGGAFAGVGIEGVWFNRLVALTMVGVVVSMLFDDAKKTVDAVPQRREEKSRKWLTHGLLLFAGFWGGLIQIGVGLLITPILYRIAGIDLVRVAAHKSLVVVLISVIALLIFATNSTIYWQAGIALAVGNGVGAWFAANAAIAKGGQLIKLALYISAAAIIAKLIIFS
ncbi:MAG: sulfite exporter TauE/SafE family protein [Pseudomonadota bacterium]